MLPSRRPLRCCCHNHHQLQLRCHYATLCHLLMRHYPSTCQLVVTLDWLSLHHLSLFHHLSTCWLVIILPLNAPPSSLPRLVASPCRCHCLSTRRLIVTSPLIAPPSCLPRLDVPAPLVAQPPLIMLAGCHVASHRATLSFDWADCRITPRCYHHHPSKSRCQPAIHCAVAADANCNCTANVESNCINVLPSFPSMPQTIMAIAMPHITIALPSHRCCATSAGADASAGAATAAGTAAAASAATTGSSLGALPPHETS
jgi:hypothetical protein